MMCVNVLMIAAAANASKGWELGVAGERVSVCLVNDVCVYLDDVCVCVCLRGCVSPSLSLCAYVYVLRLLPTPKAMGGAWCGGRWLLCVCAAGAAFITVYSLLILFILSLTLFIHDIYIRRKGGSGACCARQCEWVWERVCVCVCVCVYMCGPVLAGGETGGVAGG